MTRVPTATPVACIVHYDNGDYEDVKFKELWIRRELLEAERLERKYMKVHFPDSNLSYSWDERLTTPHRCSSLRPPHHLPIAPTNHNSSWPNSRRLDKRQDVEPNMTYSRTAPDLSSSTPFLHSLGAGPGDTSLTANAEILENPSWNFHLNAWVSSKLGQSNTYISLAGQTELIDRGISHYLPDFKEDPILPCPRYLQHMHKQTVLKPIQTGKNKRFLTQPKFWKWKGRTEQPVALEEQSKKDIAAEDEASLIKSFKPEEAAELSRENISADHPGEGEFAEEYSDYGSIKSGDIENQSSKSKPASISLTSGIDEFSDSDSQLAPLFQSSLGDKPPIEFYRLTEPPKTASSMDWEIACNLDDVESSDEDDIILGVSPSQLKRLFFSNDYIEIIEVPTFGQVEFMYYKGVTLVPGLEMTAEQGVVIYPPDKLFISDVITLHSPPPAPIPVPVMPTIPSPKEPMPPPMHTPHSISTPPTMPTPSPAKDPTPSPPVETKPKRKHIVKKKKVQSLATIKKTKPVQEEALPGMTSSFDLSTTAETEPNPVDPLPDVAEEEEPPTNTDPTPLPPTSSMKVAPTVPKKDRQRPRPPPAQLTSPSSSIELECIQEEIETENHSTDHPSDETSPPSSDDTSSSERSSEPNSSHTPEEEFSPAKIHPVLPNVNVQSPEPITEEDDAMWERQVETRESDPAPLPPPIKDATFAAEFERERLAEERRRKAFDTFERLKEKRVLPKNLVKNSQCTDASKCTIKEYEGWLAQFFIIKDDKSKIYQDVFNTMDEDDDGYLSCFETLMALKGISGTQKLTEKEEAYIIRVLELAEYSISQGTDLRLFSVLAALSQNIICINTWVRNLINSTDLATLEWKITRGKELFEWCVDEDSRKLQLDKLLVELKAGGVSKHHQEEVELTVGSKESWDLIDFLSYLPLFIMTHESVVNNPLDDSRNK